MKIIFKAKNVEKKRINKQLIAVIASFVVIVALVYFIAVSLNHVSQNHEISKLNAEAAAYARQLTSEVSVNSSACTQNYSSILNKSNPKLGCGVVFYCYYSSSCQYSGPQSNNYVSFLCDAFKPNQVIATGMCFKVALS